VIKAEWTPEEDERIFQAVEAQGKKWSVISKLFPGRSDNAIKNRWNSSLSRRVEVDDRGRRFIRPESVKRRVRMRTLVDSEPAKSSGTSPVIPLSTIALPTPVFPGPETLLSSGALMWLTPGGLGSPTRAWPLFLGAGGDAPNDSFK
jgi:hypothetical protein